ncbi:MAG: DUF817 domain-containing protein [Patescibacteria group bacterium]
MKHIQEFFIFGLKEAQASIFAGSFFVLLFLSNHLPLFGLARYDFLFLAAVGIQIILYLTKLETKDEIKVIFLFHVIGFALEAYKTHPSIGSWSYPEEGLFKIADVPLYSGFMYAAVGSYLAQAWKIFKAELTSYPSYISSLLIGIIIYINFFTNHFIQDIRFVLIPLIFIFFWKTKFLFTVTTKRRSIPLGIAFMLIAFFIWIAENISTYLGAWKYPDQIHAWQVVSFQKISSWFLMVIISFIIVAYLKHVKRYRVSKPI